MGEQITPFLSSDPDINALMHDWHHLYLPFCSQDWWVGTETAPNSWGVQFAGHLNIKAVINYLKDQGGLSDAQTVVLTGSSSGGVGVYMHADWLGDELPRSKVVAMPIAGFFGLGYSFEYEDSFPSSSLTPMENSALVTFTRENTKRCVELWHAYLPKACTDAYGQDRYLCLLSKFSGSHVKVPLFVVQAQSDDVQLMLNNHFPAPKGANDLEAKLIRDGAMIAPTPTLDMGLSFWGDAEKLLFDRMVADYSAYRPAWEYLQGFKKNQSIISTLKRGDGMFNPACFVHTGFYTEKPKIFGKSFLHAFNHWLSSSRPLYADVHLSKESTYQSIVQGIDEGVRLTDDCGILCNSDCPISPFWKHR